MCGTAPITDDAAHACSPRLDGKPTYCPDERDLILIPRQELKGEIDIYEPRHWQQIQMMFQRNIRKGQIEQTATKPSDSIDQALLKFEMLTESDQ